MRGLSRGLAALAAALVVAMALALAFGPREPVERGAAAGAAGLPADLDAWLAAREAEVPDLRPAAAKRIVWAGARGAKTDLAIVYLHGFSASAEEIRPVPDRVAEALGANLFFARLRGHGRDGPAMAEATAGDWIADLAEAVAIGRRIGERVLLIGTSTGGTLATLAAHEPGLADDLAGIALVSPNFAVNHPAAPLLTLPWARHWLPHAVGAWRGFEPVNAAHAAHWTERYPSVAVLPMAALVGHVRGLDHGRARVPAVAFVSAHDTVVSPSATAEVMAAWGGPAELRVLALDDDDDPAAHVLAGDILSPGQTDRVVALVAGWASGL